MANESRFTPTMAVDLQVVSDVQISPDGSLVAYVVAPVGHIQTIPACGIFVAAADGSSAPVCLTGRECNNTTPRWSPDSKSLAYLSDSATRGDLQLHVIPAAGGHPLRLTNYRGGVSSPAWMPDGHSVVISVGRHALAQQPAKDEITVASERPRPARLVRVSVQGGTSTPVGPVSGHVWSYSISPDGSKIAAFTSATENLSDSWDNVHLGVYAMHPTEPPVEITRFNGSVDRSVWSSDGRYLAFIASRIPDAPHHQGWIVDVPTGGLTALDERGMTQNRIDFDGSALLVLSVDRQRTQLDRVSIDGVDWERVKLPSEISQHWIRSVNLSRDGRIMALLVESDTGPANVWTVAVGGSPVRVSNVNPQLDGVTFSKLEPLQWQSTDGEQIDGWLLRPPASNENTNLPLIVYVHGGPTWQWGNWFHGTWHDWAHVLSARGYAVLLPNPRGSTGRGGEFTSANNSDLGGLDFDDVMTGVDHLINRGIADPQRLGIGGWSYGGFITAWAVGKTDRFKAAVAGAAVTNWVSKIGTTDIRRMNESNFPGLLHDNPDAFWERSPVRYLKDVKTPTLLLHGEADPRVPVTQGMEFYNGLKAAGVDTELVTYPRQKHAFHERAFQLDLLERVCDWYERYLK